MNQVNWETALKHLKEGGKVYAVWNNNVYYFKDLETNIESGLLIDDLYINLMWERNSVTNQFLNDQSLNGFTSMNQNGNEVYELI